MKNSLVFENKIYNRAENFLPRLSNNYDYYSNGLKIKPGNYVIVPIKKCSYYVVENVVIYNTNKTPCLKIIKHFSPYQFCSPIKFLPEFFEFSSHLAFGFFRRKVYFLKEKNVDFFVYCREENIPLTPRSINYVAKENNLSYLELLNLIKKKERGHELTIFNLRGGINLGDDTIDEIT